MISDVEKKIAQWLGPARACSLGGNESMTTDHRPRLRPPRRLEIHIPTRTIVKLLVVALVAWMVARLWAEFMLLAFALLFSVALAPVVRRMERQRIPRWIAVFVLAVGALGGVAVFVLFVVPPVAAQVDALIGDLPGLRERVMAQIPPTSRFFRAVVDQVFAMPSSPEVQGSVRPLSVGQTALSVAATGILFVVLTLYLLLDGRRLYAWLLAYVPRSHRGRVAQTLPGVSRMVQAFVRGQLAISALFAAFVGFTLSALGVSAALPLAILAFACDVVPVIGIIVATVPAALLALADSPWKALAVFLLFNGYHMFETYVLVPRVYGASMRLSTLTVLLALVVGGSLQGILGAILVLPIVAAYPIIERIWLKDWLSSEVLRDHEALDRAEQQGSDEAVAAVIQGERHPGERTGAGIERTPTPTPTASIIPP